jgi:hypothetical protein
MKKGFLLPERNGTRAGDTTSSYSTSVADVVGVGCVGAAATTNNAQQVAGTRHRRRQRQHRKEQNPMTIKKGFLLGGSLE